ncbi:hypothetical protein [Niveispirillum irakense]|uniref:hypothetical protein n=1 Tax=Niveispirillum irakense TaxID=34011 RepID=UPI000412F0F0|nr:hypothetical protein [Niveispirillum irakense]
MTNTSPQTIDRLRALILADQDFTTRLAGLESQDAMIAAISDYAATHDMAVDTKTIAAAPELVAQGDELSDEMLENVAAGSVSNAKGPADTPNRFGMGVSGRVRGP